MIFFEFFQYRLFNDEIDFCALFEIYNARDRCRCGTTTKTLFMNTKKKRRQKHAQKTQKISKFEKKNENVNQKH